MKRNYLWGCGWLDVWLWWSTWGLDMTKVMSLIVLTSAEVNCVSTCEGSTIMAPVSSQFCLQALYLFVSWQSGAGGPRLDHVLHAAVCHMPSLSWRRFISMHFIFPVVLLFPRFLGPNTHTHTYTHTHTHTHTHIQLPLQSVLYELWTTKRVAPAPVR